MWNMRKGEPDERDVVQSPEEGAYVVGQRDEEEVHTQGKLVGVSCESQYEPRLREQASEGGSSADDVRVEARNVFFSDNVTGGGGIVSTPSMLEGSHPQGLKESARVRTHYVVRESIVHGDIMDSKQCAQHRQEGKHVSGPRK